MADRNDLIRKLAQAVRAHTGDDDGIVLPDYWDESVWQRLLAGAELLELSNGQVLLERKASGEDLYFLVDGALEISYPRSASDSVTLRTIRPVAVVGEMSFFDHRLRSANVWACRNALAFRLPRAVFEDFRKTEPILAGDLLLALGRIVAVRLRRAIAGPIEDHKSTSFGGGY